MAYPQMGKMDDSNAGGSGLPALLAASSAPASSTGSAATMGLGAAFPWVMLGKGVLDAQNDARKHDQQAIQQAKTAYYSPWTHMDPSSVAVTQPKGAVNEGFTGYVQGQQALQAQQEAAQRQALNNAQIGYFNRAK